VKIDLGRGLYATVDDDDYRLVVGWRWCASRSHGITYAKANASPKDVLMHRVVLGLTPGDPQVDHIDRDGLNNQRSNLRLASPSQNHANQATRRLYKGVRQHPNGRWRATIVVDRKPTHLGYFDTAEDAAKAYDSAAVSAWGEFARLNVHEEER